MRALNESRINMVRVANLEFKATTGFMMKFNELFLFQVILVLVIVELLAKPAKWISKQHFAEFREYT